MVFQEWNPDRLETRLPVVLAAVGARRSGKSTAVMHLVYTLFDTFDLVVAFVGSAACCPVLEAMMERNPKWDSRFFFDSWNQPLIDKLLDQQQTLKRNGVDRNVLILMDDVVLGSKDTDQLSHMCMRGRHFNISVMMAAVSYTSISKRCRRSLDFLLVFSCPMQGDRKILSWEYAANQSSADFGLKNLRENQCVVFETSRKQQKLFVWKAQLLEPDDFRRSRLPVLRRSRIESVSDSPSGHRWASHQTGSVSSDSHIGSEEALTDRCEESTQEHLPSPSPESACADQPAELV